MDKAPGRFDYVAGADPKDYGNVALKSVSRRGIAEERVAFSNDQRFGGNFSARTSGPMQALAEGRVTWQAKAGATDTYVPSGSVRVSGTRRKCKVEGEADLTEGDGELHVQARCRGPPHRVPRPRHQGDAAEIHLSARQLHANRAGGLVRHG